MKSLSASRLNLKSDKPSKMRRRRKGTLFIFLFLLPALILLLTFVVYPIFRSVYFSTFDWNGLGPAIKNIGLGNYQRIFTDDVFMKSMVNALIIIFLSLAVQLPFALVLAVMVGRDLPGRAVFRTMFFLPYVISEVNTAIMWTLLFNANSDRGLLNAIVVLLGFDPIGWLADSKIVLMSIFFVLTWKYFGFHMLLFLAGLQNIPQEIEEAARMDGANAFQNFFNITLPLLGSTIRTSVYMSVLGSIQQFTIIWVMTGGGPVNASETMATYMYRYGIVRHQLGYGSAVAIIMFIFCLIFSLLYRGLTRKPDHLTGL